MNTSRVIIFYYLMSVGYIWKESRRMRKRDVLEMGKLLDVMAA